LAQIGGAQIVTAAQRDLWSCTRRCTDRPKPWSYTANQVSLTSFAGHNHPPKCHSHFQASWASHGMLVFSRFTVRDPQTPQNCHFSSSQSTGEDVRPRH